MLISMSEQSMHFLYNFNVSIRFATKDQTIKSFFNKSLFNIQIFWQDVNKGMRKFN